MSAHSNTVSTTRFWNNLHQLGSITFISYAQYRHIGKPNDLKLPWSNTLSFLNFCFIAIRRKDNFYLCNIYFQLKQQTFIERKRNKVRLNLLENHELLYVEVFCQQIDLYTLKNPHHPQSNQCFNTDMVN
jgi:hypothetical protein